MKAAFYRIIIPFLLTSLACPIGYAQSREIETHVVTEEDKPLPFASIAYCQPGDSLVIGGVVTDERGCCALSTPISPCLLRVSSIGYETLYRTVGADTPQPLTIRLREDATLLQGLTVTARRTPKIVAVPGGLSASIEGTLLATKPTLREVLLNLPGITDSNGSPTSLIGGSLTYYLNGRKVHRPERIRHLDPKQIKSITLITNPGAKYPGTTGAVVEIYSAEKDEGLTMRATGNVSLNRTLNDTETLDLDYQADRLSLYTLLALAREGKRSRQDQVYSRADSPEDNLSIHLSSDPARQRSLTAEAGGEYRPTSRLLLSLSGGYDAYRMSDMSLSSLRLGADGRAESDLRSDLLEKGRSGHVTLSGRAGLSDRLSLDLSTDYIGTSAQRSQLVTGEADEANHFRQTSTSNNSRYSLLALMARLDWRIGERSSLSLGEESNLIRLRHTSEGIPGEKDLSQQSSETITALYGEASCPLGPIDVSVGLRYEHQTARSEETGRHSYSSLLPYLSLSGSLLGTSQSLSLRTVALRPSLGRLSAFAYYSNRYLKQVGNPQLTRELTTTLQYALSYRDLYLSAQVRWTKDPIFSTYRTDPANPSGYIVSWRNYEHIYRAGSLLAGCSRQIGWYRPRLTVGLFAGEARIPVGESIRRLSDPMPYVSIDNGISLKRIDGSLRYTYTGKGYSSIFLTEPMHVIDLSLHASLIPDLLDLTLQWHDPLRGQVFRYSAATGEIRFSQVEDQDLSEIGLTLVWRFSNTSKSLRRPTTAQSSERRRL